MAAYSSKSSGEEEQFESPNFDKKENAGRLNPIARVILQGLYDENSELSKLNGLWLVLEKIWKHITDFWKANIKITFDPGNDKRNFESESAYLNLHSHATFSKWPELFTLNMYRNTPYLDSGDLLKFPEPTGIRINMMPFIMDVDDFKKCCLPDYLKRYWKNVLRYCPIEPEQIGKIGYLTIHESFVQANNPHRRPGIHTERPGAVRFKVKDNDAQNEVSDTSHQTEIMEFGEGNSIVRRNSFGWGMGHFGFLEETPEIQNGIYMGSNTSDSCKIYNCQIMDDCLIGELGDIEHLREYLPEGEVLEKNCLYWFTDRTPHESLPLKESKERQFFRLVTKEVSIWYEDHSTKNPCGIVPDPEKTKIVKGSKFDETGVVFSEFGDCSHSQVQDSNSQEKTTCCKLWCP